MKKFKIRASAIGQIMTMPRSKKDKEEGKLSQTTKTYCELWLKEQLYGKHKEFTSKYTTKGTEVEGESIDFFASQLNLGLLFKNDEWRENEWITGTPDIVTPDMIIDVKNSFDFTTFPLFDDELKNKTYYWQLQGYMYLFEKKEAKVCYLLTNTPEEIVEAEIRNAAYRKGEELTDEEINTIFELHNYDNTPANLRIKSFDVKYDETVIELIKLQVERCRIYIEELNNLIK